jgi:hypothetical protein
VHLKASENFVFDNNVSTSFRLLLRKLCLQLQAQEQSCHRAGSLQVMLWNCICETLGSNLSWARGWPWFLAIFLRLFQVNDRTILQLGHDGYLKKSFPIHHHHHHHPTVLRYIVLILKNLVISFPGPEPNALIRTSEFGLIICWSWYSVSAYIAVAVFRFKAIRKSNVDW